MAGDWTSPKTWSTGEELTSTDFNTHIRDNLTGLKDPATANYRADESAAYTVTGTSFALIDSADTEGKFKHTLSDYNGGDVLVICNFAFKSSADSILYLDVKVDSTLEGGNDGIWASEVHNTNSPKVGAANFVWFIPKSRIATTEPVIRLYGKRNAGTVTIYAGHGTSNEDVIGQFVVREIS